MKKGVKTTQFILVFAGNGPTFKKYCMWAPRWHYKVASIESVSLPRLVGVARGPLWRGAWLEAIGPIG